MVTAHQNLVMFAIMEMSEASFEESYSRARMIQLESKPTAHDGSRERYTQMFYFRNGPTAEACQLSKGPYGNAARKNQHKETNI